jgi:hypothetical protein
VNAVMSSPLGEIIFYIVGLLIGGAALYLISFGRVRPGPVSSRWGFQRRGRVYAVDLDLLAFAGLLVAFAIYVGAHQLGWV